MLGVVTLGIKQDGEYRLPVLKGRREALHKIHTFVTPRYKLPILTIIGSIESSP